MTNRKESERTLYEFAFYQFQDFVGQLVHRSGANCYLEINFDDEENKNEAIAKSLQLPWLRPKELLAGLTATLSNYGVKCDVGIIRDVDTGIFLGSGYATLEIIPTLVSEGQPPFLELSHVLTWIDSEISRCDKIFIHAHWNGMSVYCKYCHKTGHNTAACLASPSGRRVCYRCLERGHLRADCLLKKTGLKRSRQGKPVAKGVSPSFLQPNIESTTDILSDSPVFPTQTAQTGKEAAVPMTRESLHPDPIAIDATGGSSAPPISNQSALTSSARPKYASTSATFSDPEIDITTADGLATSMECDEPFSFDDSSMDSSPASVDGSIRMVIDNTSSLSMQEDVPQGDFSTTTPTTELIDNAVSSSKILRRSPRTPKPVNRIDL
ncbi:hypothetical protein G6F43_011176 [Rhizopus delemar]|nr:hypothetical protein G6F43_011176 [Rhizopus delemar]